MSAKPGQSSQIPLPGWRIEQKFSNKVLIGNWQEERKKFRKSSKSSYSSCYGTDFVSFPENKSGPMIRRSIMKKMEGLPKQLLLTHHGESNHKHLVSLYDDHYLRHGNSALPPLRSFSGNVLAWIPERSDYPTEEPPTNYGLRQLKEKQWKESDSEDIRSLYSASYRQPSPAAFANPRYGVPPCILSSNKYAFNNLNKKTDFRHNSPFQVPDYPVGGVSRST
ncbi:cilia- and flagella-associated protein 107 [Pelodytes ibericus]